MKCYADMTDKEKYGLVGLLAAVEAREQRDAGHIENMDPTLPPAYRSSLFPGQSLDNLDLDLTSPEPLLPTFHVFSAANPAANGPFDYTDRMTIPDYTLPSAYQVGNVPPIEGRMDALSDGTFPILITPSLHAAPTNWTTHRNPLLHLLLSTPRPRATTRRHRARAP